jgi:hypothetical protein
LQTDSTRRRGAHTLDQLKEPGADTGPGLVEIEGRDPNGVAVDAEAQVKVLLDDGVEEDALDRESLRALLTAVPPRMNGMVASTFEIADRFTVTWNGLPAATLCVALARDTVGGCVAPWSAVTARVATSAGTASTPRGARREVSSATCASSRARHREAGETVAARLPARGDTRR